MNVQEATTRRLPDLKERHLPENCRETINTILKETYGYEQFRNLEIYDDLSKGKEKLCISQGQLIENVILEAEKAWKGETQVDNILLTAPTGSGKSLLFQLPAIYLGKEYNLLTISKCYTRGCPVTDYQSNFKCFTVFFSSIIMRKDAMPISTCSFT